MLKTPAKSVNLPWKDTLYVDWHLLVGCNHNCEYSHEPPSVMDEHFSREAVLETAWNLLSLNRPGYLVHIYGGEPTIHPNFPELFKYLLTSGRNLRVVLDTNGLRSVDYYTQLLQGTPLNRVCVNLDVHLKYMSLQQLLFLIATVSKSGQFCRVIINHVPEYAEKAQMFCEKLTEFRKTVPFVLEMRLPMGGTLGTWVYAVIKEFQAAGPQINLPQWSVQQSAPKKQAFFCAGTNAVHVTTTGQCTLGLLDDDQPFAPQIIQNAVFLPNMPQVISFIEKSKAEQWLENFNLRTLHYELEGGSVRHPLHLNKDEEHLRLLLKRLTPQKTDSSEVVTLDDTEKQKFCPELWHERKQDVLSMLPVLENEASKDVFLRKLKAQILGDDSYLKDAPCSISDQERAEFTDSRIICKEEPITLQNLSALLARIKWYQAFCVLPLPDDPEWLDILVCLHKELPDYHFYLAQQGKQTVVEAMPSTPRNLCRPLPVRTKAEEPLLSVILAASGEPEDLQKSVESIQAQNLPRYEIIVVLDSDSFSISATVDEMVRKNPWQIHPFRFDTPMTPQEAHNAGLDMAQGDYICFLRSGDTLTDDILATAVTDMAKEHADVAVVGSFLIKHTIEGKSVLSRFMTGMPGSLGVAGKVYRASTLRDHLTVNKLNENLFNLPIFAFAHRILCLPSDFFQTHAESLTDTTEERCADLMTDLQTFTQFCEAHDLSLTQPECQAWMLRSFKEKKQDFMAAVRDNVHFLDASALGILRQSGNIVQSLCSELIAQNEKNGVATKFSPALEKVSCVPYADLSGGFEVDFPISIVITINKDASLTCLEALGNEDCSLVECVILDNSQSEEIKTNLEEFASMYPNFRIFRMEENATVAECWNEGLRQAQGKGIVFMTSDDELSPDFISAAIQKLNAEEKDLFVFGVQRVDSEGITEFPYMNGDAQTGAQALAWFFEKGVRIDPLGMVFNRERLIEKKIFFNPLMPEWQADFVLRSFQDSSLMLCPESACTHQETAPEKLEIKAYLGSLEATNTCYDLLDNFLSGEVTKEAWTDEALSATSEWLAKEIQTFWLPLCAVWLKTEETKKILPMPESDFFLRTLIAQYAKEKD